MVGLLLQKDDTKIIVEVGFFSNETVPSLRYKFLNWLSEELQEMDATALKRIFEVAEANINGILCFDRQYDYDCQANITDDITIEKFCCDDETDNPYFVSFPTVKECINYGHCSECYTDCPWGI